VPLHPIVLYGSRARGDHDPDSDYDVLVVVEQLDFAVQKTASRYAWEAGFGHCLLIVEDQTHSLSDQVLTLHHYPTRCGIP